MKTTECQQIEMLESIKQLFREQQYSAALPLVESLVSENLLAANLWSLRAVILQLSDSATPLNEARKCYERALTIDEHSVTAREGLAHFFDVVEPERHLALSYASALLIDAKKIVSNMEQIIRDEVSL